MKSCVSRRSSLVALVLVSVLSFASSANSAYQCRVWQPDETVELLEIRFAERVRYPLVGTSTYLSLSNTEALKLSAAVHNSISKDLVAVARGDGDLSLSLMEPRVSVFCELLD
ncbi:MAG: hypothetical protein HRT45_13390 [Bdellovibrionales bacterium]|nr:hypothetical protein [Bdellovibrionales bacterium]